MSLNHTHLTDRHQNQYTSKTRPETNQNKSICPSLVPRVWDSKRKKKFSPMKNFNDFWKKIIFQFTCKRKVGQRGGKNSSSLSRDHCCKRISTHVMHTKNTALLYLLYHTYIMWGVVTYILWGANLYFERQSTIRLKIT